MVRSSAAALKSFLPPLKTPPFGLSRTEGRAGGRQGGISVAPFQKYPKSKRRLCRPFRTVNTNLFLCGLSNLSNQAGITDFASPGISKNLLLWTVFFFCRSGRTGGWAETLPQVSSPPSLLSRHPLAFHASWYYRLFIQPLFKLDADRVALDMCIAGRKKNKIKQKKKKT